MNYRKLWESTYGDIPKDDKGRSYEIHHKDGNRNNNELSNLMCVSLDEHYEIHSRQYIETGNMKDLAAARYLAGKLGKEADELRGYTIPLEQRKKISNKLKGIKHSKERIEAIKLGRKKGKQPTKEDIEARTAGIRRYYEEEYDRDSEFRKDVRRRISEAHKGKVLSESTKEKLARHNAKHSDEVVLEIDKMITDGVRYRIISEKYDISQAQISQIKHRKTYKWLWK